MRVFHQRPLLSYREQSRPTKQSGNQCTLCHSRESSGKTETCSAHLSSSVLRGGDKSPKWWFWLVSWAKWHGLDLTRCLKPPEIFFDPQGGPGGGLRGAARGPNFLLLRGVKCYDIELEASNFEKVPLEIEKNIMKEKSLKKIENIFF